MKRLLIIVVLLANWQSGFCTKNEKDSITIHKQIDEIVITSFKQGHRIKQLPLSGTELPLKTLNTQKVENVKDLSATIPNLFMTDYGSKLSSAVYIRGIGSTSSPAVGLYVDGIPYFDKSLTEFNFADIDRIEVLRGPQGTLYGRNTMGGLINVYTKSPFTNPGTNIQVEGGNHGLFNGTLSHYGTINNKFGYSASGNYRHSNGYFTNHYNNTRADNLDEATGRIKLSWHPTDQLSMHLSTSYEYTRQGGYPYGTMDDKGKINNVDYNDKCLYLRKLFTAGYTLSYKNDGIWLNSQTSYQRYTDKVRMDQDFSESDKYYVIEAQKEHMWSEELNIKNSYESNYNWLFGAFGFVYGINRTVDFNYKQLGYRTFKNYDDPSKGFALFHQSTINDLFVSNLSMIVGLRWDVEWDSQNYDNNKIVSEKSTRLDEIDRTNHYSQVTPKATLQYSFDHTGTAYASVTRGYKTGGFNTSFDTEDECSYNPEYSWNYELGTKLNSSNNRLHLEAALFLIDWKNQQIYQATASGVGKFTRNAGRSQSKGFELSGSAEIMKNLTINGAYGYTYAKFKDYVLSDKVSYTGNYLPFVPKETIYGGVTYLIPMRGLSLSNIRLNVNYVGTGRLYWREDNIENRPYYGLLNTSADFNFGKTTISIWGKNVTNTDYTAYYFTMTTGKFGQKGKPITAGISVSLHL